MLTVKHVAEGREEIYCAPHGVMYLGTFAVLGNEGPGWSQGGPRLFIKGPDEAETLAVLYRGTAYVMNETGATIGMYRLGYPPMSEPVLQDCAA